jgi:hypothetical protein
VWINTVDDEMGDTMSKGFRFAGSCSRDNQKWPCGDSGTSFDAVLDSLPLLCVQVIEVIKRHCGYLPVYEKNLLQLLIRLRIVILNHLEPV